VDWILLLIGILGAYALTVTLVFMIKRKIWALQDERALRQLQRARSDVEIYSNQIGLLQRRLLRVRESQTLLAPEPYPEILELVRYALLDQADLALEFSRARGAQATALEARLAVRSYIPSSVPTEWVSHAIRTFLMEVPDNDFIRQLQARSRPIAAPRVIPPILPEARQRIRSALLRYPSLTLRCYEARTTEAFQALMRAVATDLRMDTPGPNIEAWVQEMLLISPQTEFIRLLEATDGFRFRRLQIPRDDAPEVTPPAPSPSEEPEPPTRWSLV
jgi:hypothetical protein